MAQDIPKTTKQWVVAGEKGFDSLSFTENDIPALGDNQVLVKCKRSYLPSSHALTDRSLVHAASLNVSSDNLTSTPLKPS